MNKNKQHALELRRLDLTLREIGLELDVSKQAVGQLIGKGTRVRKNERFIAPYVAVVSGVTHVKTNENHKDRLAALSSAKSATRAYKRTGDRKKLATACWLIRKWGFKVEEFK